MMTVCRAGSYFAENAVDSAVTGVVSPTIDPQKSSSVTIVASRVYWMGRAIASSLLAATLLPISGVTSLIATPQQPDISFVISDAPLTSSSHSFHLMTSNTALGPRWLTATAHLAPSVERASLIAQKITSLTEEELPDVFLGQEVWDENATQPLVDSLKNHYGYIAHSIGYNRIGKSSGLFVASRFPIVNAEFRPFPVNRLEAFNKGVIRVVLDVNGKNIAIYNLHNEAIETDQGAEFRSQSLASVLAWIRTDQDNFDDIFVAGDFNVSRLNNHQEPMAEYSQIQESFFQYFNDPFLAEHEDEVRTKGESRYIEMDAPGTSEPQGSYFSKEAMEIPEPVGDVPGCRYDYILRYKKDSRSTEGTAEIRRIFGKLTDHLAVSANFNLENLFK
jgi:endonuclease/exonuclease/phosphatase family metal-dependent hydrolase